MLLAVGTNDGLPVTIPRVRLVHDPDPVAAPPTGSPSWVFAVENEALLSWAWRNAVDAPVVWHNGTTAARLLLVALGRAGWRIAVSADFEQGGLIRAVGLLSAVPTAHPWRLSARDYLAAVADRSGSGPPLSTIQVSTAWDLPLGRLLVQHRIRVTEEDRFDALAGDMAAGAPNHQ